MRMHPHSACLAHIAAMTGRSPWMWRPRSYPWAGGVSPEGRDSAARAGPLILSLVGMTAFTPEHAAVLVRGHTPLAADEVRELGRGADSVAFLVDATWVFRFPMVANARTTLRREVARLPLLRSALPLPTPQAIG